MEENMFIFPYRIDDILIVRVTPPHNPDTNVMLQLQFYLAECLACMFCNQCFTYKYETVGDSECTAQFSFAVDFSAPLLAASGDSSDVVVVSGSIALPYSHAIEYTMGDLLLNQRLIMELAGVKHLSLVTDESTRDAWQLRPIYTDCEFRNRRLHFKFNRDIAVEGDGLNFANLGQITFAKFLIGFQNQEEGEIIQETVSIAHLQYRNIKMCSSCFGKLVHEAKTQCPYRDHCKLCWGYHPDSSHSPHILFECPVVQELEARAQAKGLTIFPVERKKAKKS